MLFNSIEFFVFLPIIFVLYWFVFNKKINNQNALVLIASYFFYGWWSWKFMCLLMLSTCLDYGYGFWVASPNRNKAKIFLWLSVINNLGVLAVFKYYNFFATEFQSGLALLGLKTNFVLLHFALPVGISFYTFHGMSYVFDIYRGHQKPVKSFIEYAVFVSFFPLLVAGPVERASHLLPQVQRKREFNYTQAVEGCRLMLYGLFKKMVIADSLANIVDGIFGKYENYNAYTLLIGAIAFSFQIYADFSGYSDIALGTAKLFGFELLSNFKFPYFSRDVAEFWRRWHISLSSWFRDYLYIPLGGSKEGKYKAIRNTFIIFLVSGFWHGASWNYIAWGFVHACGFLPLLLLNRNRKYVSSVVAEDRKIPNLRELWQIGMTFVFVTFAWIFFRANNMKIAIDYIGKIITDTIQNPSQFLILPQGKMVFVYAIALLLFDWPLRRNEKSLKFSNSEGVRYAIYTLLIIAIFTVFVLDYLNDKGQDFIYFQF